MAEQQLNPAQIGAGIEQMCGEGVAQHVRAERLADAQLFTQLLADDPDRVRLQRFLRPFPGKEPVLGLAPAPLEAQQLEQLG